MFNTCIIDLLMGDILISTKNLISESQVLIMGGINRT